MIWAAVTLFVWLAGASVVAAVQPQQDAPSGSPPAAASPDPAKPAKHGKEDKNSSKPAAQPSPAPVEKGADEYRIGVDDSLFISVWRETDLSGQVTVRPDGVITMPLLNDVKVVGLTPAELQTVLTDKLKGFVNEPQVTVIVRDIKSRKVFLVGEVGHQGSFPLSGHMTMLELLAQAGGLGQYAKSESIYVLRTQGGQQVRIPFKYKKVLDGKSPDVVLHPGDMIVVP